MKKYIIDGPNLSMIKNIFYIFNQMKNHGLYELKKLKNILILIIKDQINMIKILILKN